MPRPRADNHQAQEALSEKLQLVLLNLTNFEELQGMIALHKKRFGVLPSRVVVPEIEIMGLQVQFGKVQRATVKGAATPDDLTRERRSTERGRTTDEG